MPAQCRDGNLPQATRFCAAQDTGANRLAKVALRGLLFDFDGLILDTETPELTTWRELWAEHGHEFPLDRFLAGIGTVGGFGALAALEEVAAPFDRGAVSARHAERKRALLELEELRPGILDYLEHARRNGLATAIVSSSSRRWVDLHLDRLNRADLFDLIVTGDHDRKRGKPAPTLYLEALAGLGLAAEEAVAFEDSPNGVRAAKAAGIFCVAVPNGVTESLDLGEADLLVASLADLPFERLLAELGHPG
jgi:HAD superfamily hydrolase (TIGR01509 family)